MPIASARRRVVTSTGGFWARPCRRCRARGPQDSAAITRPPAPLVVAQHHDAAAAQLGHGAFDGGDCRRACGNGPDLESCLLDITPRDFAEVNRFCAQIVPDRVNFEMADR